MNKIIFQPKRLTSYDDDSIINEVKRVVSKYFNGKIPSKRSFDKYSMVSSGTVATRFGSWFTAMRKAGFILEKTKSFEPSRMIEDLKRVGNLTQGKVFSQEFYRNNGGLYTPKILKKYLRFTDWQDMLEKLCNLKRYPKVYRILNPQARRKRISSFTGEQLFLELKRIWDILGRRPTYDEFRKMGNIGTKVYERRFVTWRKAIELFYGKYGYNIKGNKGVWATPEILLSELRRIAEKTPSAFLYFKDYKKLGGNFSIGTFRHYFGSWAEAVKKVGREDGKSAFSNEKLFTELQLLWEKLGRQPKSKEMDQFGEISSKVYMERFGSWIKAMHAFCLEREKIDDDNTISRNIEIGQAENKIEQKLFQEESEKKETQNYILMKTSRTPSLRLRFQVFRRDNFRCVQCGRSPATRPGLELEADHIKPYSKGGETVIGNLQTLCKDCNQGKSDISD